MHIHVHIYNHTVVGSLRMHVLLIWISLDGQCVWHWKLREPMGRSRLPRRQGSRLYPTLNHRSLPNQRWSRNIEITSSDYPKITCNSGFCHTHTQKKKQVYQAPLQSSYVPSSIGPPSPLPSHWWAPSEIKGDRQLCQVDLMVKKDLWLKETNFPSGFIVVNGD